MGQETLVLGVVVDETLKSTADHGVLAHEDNTLTTETHTNLVHLLGADIVDGDKENSLVLVKKPLELIEVSGLGSGFAPHVFLIFVKRGCLRANGENCDGVDVSSDG